MVLCMSERAMEWFLQICIIIVENKPSCVCIHLCVCTLYDQFFLFVSTQVVPVLLQGLPLKEDMEENETVFKCIVKLITAKNPVVSGQYFSAWASIH